MSRGKKQRYKVDNSGVIHMASMRRGHANFFRIAATLTHSVDVRCLQQALDAVTSRFPTLVAGIRPGLFHFFVVPVERPPAVQRDGEFLAPMTYKELERCAIRVCCGGSQFAVEIFHGLTDGYGGMTFIKALLAEYLRLAHGVDCTGEEDILTVQTPQTPAETEDSFAVYGETGKGAPFHGGLSYQLPCPPAGDTPIHRLSASYGVEALLDSARKHGVTLNILMATLMGQSIMEVQKGEKGKGMKPVQLLLPVDLRRRFPSRTLRNFSLYALPRITPEDAEQSLPQLARQITGTLQSQFDDSRLRAMMATNQSIDRWTWWIPLVVKLLALRVGYLLVGERTSCLTMSNVGEFALPGKMRPYVERVDIFLTPRASSGYNCVFHSCNGQLNINFSRRGEEPLLERCFLRRLAEMGHVPLLEADGLAVGLDCI